MSLQVEKDSLYFKGVGGAEKKTYELTMKFLKEVDTETVKFKAKGQGIDVAIEKVWAENLEMILSIAPDFAIS